MGSNARMRKGQERAQSELLGLVLLVGLTVAGVTFVLVAGSAALDDSRQASQLGSAEHAMTQLDSQISLVALGASDRQRVTIQRSDTNTRFYADGSTGWMNVTVVNETTGAVEDVVMNTTLGAIVYTSDETTVAYQGGGVWRLDPSGGSVMVSPPEFHYRTTGGEDPTLTLPLVVVRGDRTIDRSLIVEKNVTDGKYPLISDPSRSNPLDKGKVNVTIQSDYYEAWGTFFEGRTGGDVTYDHGRNEVTISLVIPQSSPMVGGGIVSGAAGTTLNFHNHAETDSYNSSQGDYATTQGDNTSIVAAGDFELGNHGLVKGNLEVGGSVTLNNQAEVTGNVSYGGTLSNSGTIGGWTQGGAEVEAPDAADWLIDTRRAEISGTNDNGPEGDISGNSLQNCASTCDLTAGNYYLDDISLGSGDHLLLNTSSGDINIVVDGDASVGNAKVEVTGGGRAKLFVEGDADVGGSGNVTVPGERSPGIWFYMNSGATFSFGNGARFVGIVYGPGNGAQNGVDISLSNNVKIFGALVGDVDFINNHMDIHFDEALLNEDPMAGVTGSSPEVTYLHVTINSVNATA